LRPSAALQTLRLCAEFLVAPWIEEILDFQQKRANQVPDQRRGADADPSRNHKTVVKEVLADAGGAGPVKVDGGKVAWIKAEKNKYSMLESFLSGD
jgi:hypothetical protein